MPRVKKNEGEIRFVDLALHEQLKVIAIAEDRSISYIVRRILREWLTQQREEGK